MPSSTSSSDRPRPAPPSRARRQRRCLWLFLAAFLAAGALARVAAPRAPALNPSLLARGECDRPEPGAFLAYRDGTVDHYVYYLGLRGAVAHARAADLLLLGNSNAGLGFSHRRLRPYGARAGLRVYNLTFNLNERAAFAETVMRRFAIWPRFVVVNADGFFSGGMSAAAEAITRQGNWRSFCDWTEKVAGFAIKRRLHRCLPYFDWSRRITGDGLVYRAPADGAWLVVKGPRADLPLDPRSDEGAVPDGRDVAEARAFRREVERHGGTLLITLVPHPGGSLARARALAARIGAPFIEPLTEGLRLRDHSHLTDAAADRFTDNFLQAFETWRAAQSAPAGMP